MGAQVLEHPPQFCVGDEPTINLLSTH